MEEFYSENYPYCQLLDMYGDTLIKTAVFLAAFQCKPWQCSLSHQTPGTAVPETGTKLQTYGLNGQRSLNIHL